MTPTVWFTSPVPVTASAPELEADVGADGAELEPREDDDSSSSSRTIEGLLMPYGVEARASDGLVYRFRPGSLRERTAGTPVLLGHDSNRPAGILAALVHADDGATAVVSVDATADGDTALAQARSGSRSGLSIGAEPTVFTITAGDVIDVEEAELCELSLVSIPAWAGARVSRVTATAEPGGSSMSARIDDPGAAPPTGESVPSGLAGVHSVDSSASAPLPAIVRADTPPIRISGERLPARLTCDRYVQAMLRAAKGDHEAARLIQAAITPSFAVDNPGVLPPAITSDILDGLETDRALVDNACAVKPMPDAGMKVQRPVWTTRPNGGWMATDQAAVPTNTPKIGTAESDVEQWAYAFATSVAVAERGTPDFIEAVYAEAIQDYYDDCEARVAALIVAAVGATPAGTVGEGIAAVYSATKKVPNVILAAPDAYGEMIDATGTSRFTAGSAGVSSGGLTGDYGGLRVVVSGHLPAGAFYVGLSNAIEFRETNPVRLSANVVGAMTMELGITSFALFEILKANAFAPGTVPTEAPVALRAGSRSSK